jgi:hypothetical protein
MHQSTEHSERHGSARAERETMTTKTHDNEASAATDGYDVNGMQSLGFTLDDTGEWYVLTPHPEIRNAWHHRLRHARIAWRPRDDRWQVNGLGSFGPRKTLDDVRTLMRLILGVES